MKCFFFVQILIQCLRCVFDTSWSPKHIDVLAISWLMVKLKIKLRHSDIDAEATLGFCFKVLWPAAQFL